MRKKRTWFESEFSWAKKKLGWTSCSSFSPEWGLNVHADIVNTSTSLTNSFYASLLSILVNLIQVDNPRRKNRPYSGSKYCEILILEFIQDNASMNTNNLAFMSSVFPVNFIIQTASPVLYPYFCTYSLLPSQYKQKFLRTNLNMPANRPLW